MQTLRSFRPIADARSRVLILGSMPGPVALARREYYGFPGNLFWRILPDVLGEPPPRDYREKVALLRRRRIALWDTIRSCTRVGASDGSIRDVVPNDIAGLLKRRPGIGTIFLNGKLAEKLYRAHFGGTLHIAAYYLPSTSPAHASMSYAAKKKAWQAVLPYLENRNPWC